MFKTMIETIINPRKLARDANGDLNLALQVMGQNLRMLTVPAATIY